MNGNKEVKSINHNFVFMIKTTSSSDQNKKREEINLINRQQLHNKRMNVVADCVCVQENLFLGQRENARLELQLETITLIKYHVTYPMTREREREIQQSKKKSSRI